MTDNKDTRKLLASLRRKYAQAAFIITIERLSLHGWRLACWLVLFAGLWMTSLPPALGASAETLAPFLCAAGILYFSFKDVSAFRVPSRKDIYRRLETDSALPHHPLAGLHDTLANPGPDKTEQLWQQRRDKIIEILHSLRSAKPKPLIADRDRYGLRFGVVLVFTVGLMMAGSQWDDRILDGIKPPAYEQQAKQTSSITLTISPPEYTGQEQILLTKSDTKPVLIPEGSDIQIRATNILGTPSLYYSDQKKPLNKLGPGSYETELAAPDATTLTLKSLLVPLASWDYTRVKDEPPAIALKGEAQITHNAQIKIPVSVYDDYGVRDIRMHMDIDEMVTDAPLGMPVNEYRSVMSPGDQNFDFTPVYDLTSHSWAGLPVDITLTVSDHKNQTAQTEKIKIVLPERLFRHPIAKRLVELRKRLAWELEGAAPDISKELEIILSYPSTYQDDNITFLALRSASSRLRLDHSLSAIQSVITLLWDTALRIEDGNLSLAARDLRDTQNALEEALKDPNTTDQEIARLMQDLREAMTQYMHESQKELQKQMAEGKTQNMINPQALTRMINPQAMASFLDQMESEMMRGDRQSAQEMLSQLQRMTDILNPNITMEMPQDMQQMVEGINELQELIDRQQKLLDQTRLKEQQKLNTQNNRAEQEALRLILGELMLDTAELLPEIPETLGLAEQEMRKSSDNLGANNPGGAIPHQEKALEYLKDGMQQMGQQLMARMQSMTGMNFSGARYDPLGRPYGDQGPNGSLPGSRVVIPDEAQRGYVDEILQLLRRRSGELDRPDDELDYYRRLLRQF